MRVAAARAATPVTGFVAAETTLAHLVTRLQSTDMAHMSHSDLERLLEQEGRELLRQLLQAHLDLRAQTRATEPVVWWKIPLLTKHPDAIRIRQIMPFGFVSMVLLLVLGSAFLAIAKVLLLLSSRFASPWRRPSFHPGRFRTNPSTWPSSRSCSNKHMCTAPVALAALPPHTGPGSRLNRPAPPARNS